MYADDTKLLAKIRKDKELEDINELQNDIDKITTWTNTWLMRLNIEKCKIMHVGKKNIQHNYSMIKYDNEDRLVLKKTQTEKDLGILFSNDLKSTAQSTN